MSNKSHGVILYRGEHNIGLAELFVITVVHLTNEDLIYCFANGQQSMKMYELNLDRYDCGLSSDYTAGFGSVLGAIQIAKNLRLLKHISSETLSLVLTLNDKILIPKNLRYVDNSVYKLLNIAGKLENSDDNLPLSTELGIKTKNIQISQEKFIKNYIKAKLNAQLLDSIEYSQTYQVRTAGISSKKMISECITLNSTKNMYRYYLTSNDLPTTNEKKINSKVKPDLYFIHENKTTHNNVKINYSESIKNSHSNNSYDNNILNESSEFRNISVLSFDL